MEREQLVFRTSSGEQTQRIAGQLGALLAGDAVITLTGDLGAGKTTFAQGLGAGLGVKGAITSPTFVLINRYRCGDGRQLQHADCYRLANTPLEMWDAGLTDLFMSDDVVVVEWADRIPGLLPADYLDIVFEHGEGDDRRIVLTAHGARYVHLLRQLQLQTGEQA